MCDWKKGWLLIWYPLQYRRKCGIQPLVDIYVGGERCAISILFVSRWCLICSLSDRTTVAKNYAVHLFINVRHSYINIKHTIISLSTHQLLATIINKSIGTVWPCTSDFLISLCEPRGSFVRTFCNRHNCTIFLYYWRLSFNKKSNTLTSLCLSSTHWNNENYWNMKREPLVFSYDYDSPILCFVGSYNIWYRSYLKYRY